MTALLAINLIVLLFLAVIWSASTMTNILIKLVLIILTVANGFFLFTALGYIVAMV